MKRTEEEIDKIKYAVKPLTPEERVRLKAIKDGQLAPEEVEIEKPATAGIPEEALKARAIELGVPVGSLTTEQIEEVRASLPERPVRARSTRR